MTELLHQRARALTTRRTAMPREHYERLLTCIRCGDLVAVMEAAQHPQPHEHLEAASYVCSWCLDAPVMELA